ncbi:asparagine synthase (glutamine-hydrolyzing) [Candidatus Wolfebacteria bacterium]|nr:asparagine synthase (glutamine-hydrolyzing) [Candidatus Wolfebacteria bacterium]
MCGIIGVLGNIPEQKIIEGARDTMEHRGPDDAGLYYSKKEDIALGHRRLSIIDLSSAGHQPFFSNDGRFVTVFNGEIYNYLEIKQELKDFYDFKTKTDTEVVLASYRKWGEKCLNKFNGMFALAIWDKVEQKLFIARDRFGKKPFYYCQRDNNFYFASEIKGILYFNNIPRKLNRKGFLDYLSYRYVLGGETLFEGIKSLLPGHYSMIEKGNGFTQIPYWELSIVIKKEDPGEEEVIKKTTELLMESVRLRLRSDVPTGAYLSGGLDSSLIVALVSALLDKPIKTFSIGFPEEGFSELAYAKIVADKFKTEHHEFILNGEEYFKNLLAVIKSKDSPLLSPNEVAWYVLSFHLKKYITVVLSGGGADELFGGYGRIFRSGYDLERLNDLDSFDKEEREILIKNLGDKYSRLDFSSVVGHFLSQYPYLKDSLKRKLLNPEIFNQEKDLLNKNYFQSFFNKLSGLHPTDQYLYIFQNMHLLGTLESLDSVTMPASVEARAPYVDYKLVEYVSALPLKYKIAWKSKEDEVKARLLNSTQISEIHDITKYLMRKIAANYLPPEIMRRKKLGFPVPLDKWFRGKFQSLAKDFLFSSESKSKVLYNQSALSGLLNHEDGLVQENHGMHIWMLLNLEMWLREYNVTI